MKLLAVTALLLFTLDSSAFAIRINCGGLSFPDGALADSSMYHSKTSAAVRSYFGKKPGSQKSVFSTHSWTSNTTVLKYSLPVENWSPYNLSLYFAENRPSNFARGRRVFHISVNNKFVRYNVDPWKYAGSYKPYVVKIPYVSPKNNEILVKIVPKKGNPMISAIQYVLVEPLQQKQSPALVKPKYVSPIKVRFSRVRSDYPLKVFEAAGTVMRSKTGKNYLVVFGGYHKFPNVTRRVYRREFGGLKRSWQRLADLPIKITHLAQWVDGNGTFCGVGGYEGDYPGVSGKKAFCYDMDTDTYNALPDLPADRAGGGLVLIKKNRKRFLLYAGGVDRVTNSLKHHVDYGTTWKLEYDVKGANWTKASKDMPHPRNHMAAVESCGRYYFVGGQKTINEHSGNSRRVDEFLVDTMQWSKNPPPPLPFPLGHVSASVMPYKCGIMIIGGMGNNRTMMNSVLYFNSTRNEWSQIGNYSHKVATPVCGIVNDRIMCATGGEFLKRNDVFIGKIHRN